MKNPMVAPIFCMVALLATMAAGIYITLNKLGEGIEEAGGIKHIITEVGKEVKDISTEIENYEPSEAK